MLHQHSLTPLPMLSHLYTGDTGRAHHQNSTVFPHNNDMPGISSAEVETDAARLLAEDLANPAPAPPFARFGSRTMDAIRRLAEIFDATGAQPPTPTPPSRRTHATIQLPMLQRNTDPKAHPRVPPTVHPCRPPRPPQASPPKVDSPARNPPHSYPLRSHVQAKHTVDIVGEGAVAFQGVLDPNIVKTQGYTQLIHTYYQGTCTTAFSNDIRGMAQGVVNHNKGKNTIFFIQLLGVLAGNRVTYGRIVVSIRPNKTETHRLCITVGGDNLSCKVPTATQCASLVTKNILVNSVVSTILAMFMCADIHDF